MFNIFHKKNTWKTAQDLSSVSSSLIQFKSKCLGYSRRAPDNNSPLPVHPRVLQPASKVLQKLLPQCTETLLFLVNTEVIYFHTLCCRETARQPCPLNLGASLLP